MGGALFVCLYYFFPQRHFVSVALNAGLCVHLVSTLSKHIGTPPPTLFKFYFELVSH